jgi:hypothetical protein
MIQVEWIAFAALVVEILLQLDALLTMPVRNIFL